MVIKIVMAVFALLGGLDRIFGNKLGIGKEFEKGFMLLGNMALSMIGMITLAPVIADALSPLMNFFYEAMGMDPSVIPAIVFANDMGGAPLAVEVAKNMDLGMFNALVVSSMMGATISYTIPYALEVVKNEKIPDVFLGFLCGIVTIPIGCFVSGLVLGLPILALLWNVFPLVLFSVLISLGLVYAPRVSVKIFGILGLLMRGLITVGLLLGMVKALFGYELIKGIAPIEEGAMICLNASVVLAGAFPLMNLLTRLLNKPLHLMGEKLGLNETSSLGLLTTLVTNATTFEMVERMDKKGTVLCSALAVSGAFTFGGHLAFTMAFHADYIFPVLIGKLLAGFTAVALAVFIYRHVGKREESH